MNISEKNKRTIYYVDEGTVHILLLIKEKALSDAPPATDAAYNTPRSSR